MASGSAASETPISENRAIRASSAGTPVTSRLIFHAASNSSRLTFFNLRSPLKFLLCPDGFGSSRVAGKVVKILRQSFTGLSIIFQCRFWRRFHDVGRLGIGRRWVLVAAAWVASGVSPSLASCAPAFLISHTSRQIIAAVNGKTFVMENHVRIDTQLSESVE